MLVGVQLADALLTVGTVDVNIPLIVKVALAPVGRLNPCEVICPQATALHATFAHAEVTPEHPHGSAFTTNHAGRTSFITTLVASPQVFLIMILNSKAIGEVYAMSDGVPKPTPEKTVPVTSFCCLSIVRLGRLTGLTGC